MRKRPGAGGKRSTKGDSPQRVALGKKTAVPEAVWDEVFRVETGVRRRGGRGLAAAGKNFVEGVLTAAE